MQIMNGLLEEYHHLNVLATYPLSAMGMCADNEWLTRRVSPPQCSSHIPMQIMNGLLEEYHHLNVLVSEGDKKLEQQSQF